MIDIQLVRENPELVKKKSAEKNIKVDVDKLLQIDNSRKTLIQEVEALRARRNEISEQMKGSLNGGGPDPSLVDAGKQIKVELAEREDLLAKTNVEFDLELKKIPNLHFDDVPSGDESASLEIKRFGDCEKTGAKDHLDFAVEKDWVDFERGAKVASTKFYFLKGDLALLENALLQYGLEVMAEEGFILLSVPHLVNSRSATGAGFAPRSDKEGNEYFVEDEDLSLIATAEMPLTGYHADEIMEEDSLPLMYAGYSPCYRREAGTYGKHSRGLFRVHQFNKLEMYIFSTPEQSQLMHEKILAIEEKIWQTLGIPYHVINIASGDLGAPAAKKYDLEYWSPVDGAFRELTSCSNCTDFQARNVNVRLKMKDGSIQFAHTLNGTAISMARSLVAIIEHYQNDDGSLRIPDVLQKFMGGRQTI